MVLFSWRLLREIARHDSVLPWVTIVKRCGCLRPQWCSHFHGAVVQVSVRDGCDVAYNLIHGLPVNGGGAVVSDAIAGRLRR